MTASWISQSAPTGSQRTRKLEAASNGFDASRLTAVGYSNGANILASAVFAEPALFDAAVLMHPLIPFEPRIAGDLSGKRILITAGRRDPICPPTQTTRLESYLRAANVDVTLAWHEGGHEMRPGEIEAARRFLAPYAVQVRERSA